MPKKKYEISWEQIYDYVLACGSVHDPYHFIVTALDEINTLIPYDQGLVYCLDENRNVVAQHLVNIKPRWSNMYLEYYSQLQGTTRTLDVTVNENFGLPHVEQIMWSDEPTSEFKLNYIMARGVTASLAMVLFDQNSLPRVSFSLDRTRSPRFSEKRMDIARLVTAQLGNLYKNFFISTSEIPGKKRTDKDPVTVLLTRREREVVDLMCQGLAPAHVAATLHISTSTAYKHIAHIYKKLHVSSQQELLVRVLGNR